MIGYYVHHHGRGHLHRAVALSSVLGEPVTGLSSMERPGDWPRAWDWVALPSDDDAAPHHDATPGHRLHWVPRHHDGLLRRSTAISAWLERARPHAVVVDLSVEVTTLVRLHGVPVVSVVLPGRRTDPAHRLGLDLADALVGMWPAHLTARLLPGLPAEVHARVHGVGALSRHEVGAARDGGRATRAGRRRVLVLGGAGGEDLTPAVRDRLLDRARAATPGWDWQVAGPGRWLADPGPAIRAAHVVVTHAGQNAVAEVAAARRPALLVPQDRPHDEQRISGDVLGSGGWPARVRDELPGQGWSALLDEVASLPGDGWADWCDGRAAERFAEVVREVA